MARKEITPALVDQIERLLAEKVDLAAISGRLGITQYVVGVIAGDDERRIGPSHPQRRVSRRVPNTKPRIDATTIRMIQRMLAAGMLSHVDIAREAGVSSNTVSDVASGKRRASGTAISSMQPGERFLPTPIRCSLCRALISVVPCRACHARQESASKKSV